MGRAAGEDRDGVLFTRSPALSSEALKCVTAAPMAVSPIEETVVPRTGPFGPTEMRSSELSALWLKWSMAKSVLSAAMAGAAKDAARAAAARVMESFMLVVLFVRVFRAFGPVFRVWCVRLLCLSMIENCAFPSSLSIHESRRNVKPLRAYAQ
jgi:hypothetical protein